MVKYTPRNSIKSINRKKYKKHATLISPQYPPIDIPFNTYDEQANMTNEEIENQYNILKTHKDRADFISGLTYKNLAELDKSIDKSIYETEIKSSQENFNTYETKIKNMNGEEMVNYYNKLEREQQVDFINTLTSLQGNYTRAFENALIQSILTGHGKRNKKRSTRHKKRRGKKTRKYGRKY
jgi:hypothetical protein